MQNHTMFKDENTLSVQQAAVLCGLSRGTINYWIRTKKLYARRSGRNYSIPVEGLIQYLKSAGRKIPSELKYDVCQGRMFASIQPCWEYWSQRNCSQACRECVVCINKLDPCFTARAHSRLNCSATCHECQYYRDIYRPRSHFIHQIDLPAAIVKDLYIWGGNRKFSELCEVQEKDLIGMGIEVLVHPDSLPIVISNIKKRALGDPTVPRRYNVFLNNSKHEKLGVDITVCPLKEPLGTNLIVAEH